MSERPSIDVPLKALVWKRQQGSFASIEDISGLSVLRATYVTLRKLPCESCRYSDHFMTAILPGPKFCRLSSQSRTGNFHPECVEDAQSKEGNEWTCPAAVAVACADWPVEFAPRSDDTTAEFVPKAYWRLGIGTRGKTIDLVEPLSKGDAERLSKELSKLNLQRVQQWDVPDIELVEPTIRILSTTGPSAGEIGEVLL